jgi:arginyl-tRNA synthetase
MAEEKPADAKAVTDGKPAAEETKKEEGKKEESKKEEAKKPKIGKMKTREGDSTKLMELLDEAKNRTLDIFRERMKEDDDAEGGKQKV